MVVREHDILDRLVGHLANAPDDVLRHHGRRLRIRDENGIVANDDARIRVALGRVRVGVVRELVEAHPLFLEIGL